MRLTAGGLAIALCFAAACGSLAQAAPAPETHLSCAGSLTESVVADYVEGGRDNRSPEQQAKEYGAAVGRAFSGQRKVVYQSSERTDISFADNEGRIQAVLSYQYHGGQGWRLEHGVSCAVTS